jgi:lysyl-tRNA synthetase class II
MKTWIRIILGLAITGIIAAVLGYFFIYNKPHPDYEHLKADFMMQTQAMFDEFAADNNAANQKYNGKMIELTGPITRMEITDSLTTAVFVFRQGDFGDEGIRCTVLPKFMELAQNLQPGYCTGYTGDVIFEQCSIEQ